MGNVWPKYVDKYADAFTPEEKAAVFDLDLETGIAGPSAGSLLGLLPFITKGSQQSPLNILKIIYSGLQELDRRGSPVPIYIDIPAGTPLFRTFVGRQAPVTRDILFCDPSPMGNIFIRNPGSTNNTMAVLRAKKPLRLLNFIPISMLFGCQVKSGKNCDIDDGSRGFFANCFSYGIIKQFCQEMGFDGIILTDSADYYSYTKSKSITASDDDVFVPPELYAGTPGRDKLDALMVHHLKAGLAFPKFDGKSLDTYDIQGAIYPEFILESGLACVDVVESIPFDRFYTSEELYSQYSETSCIQHRPHLNDDLQLHHDLRARQFRMNATFKSPYFAALPCLFDPRNDVIALELIKQFFSKDVLRKKDTRKSKGVEGGKKLTRRKKSLKLKRL
jgi:hypothetical protein